MHPLPPHLANELCQARRAELERRQHQTDGSARRTGRRKGGRSLRRAPGWFLVELGLRLAAPYPPVGAVR